MLCRCCTSRMSAGAGTIPNMASSNKATISARERVRKANAERLAAEQARLKKNEDDLVSYFTASADFDKAESDLEEKIRKLRAEAEEKKQSALHRQATALLDLKERGESTTSIAELTDLTEAKVRELIRLAKPKTKSQSPTETAATTDTEPNAAPQNDASSTPKVSPAPVGTADSAEQIAS